MTRIMVTGAAGFIGFHLCKLLLSAGHTVFGHDGMTEYYDVSLKQARLAQLREFGAFTFHEGALEDANNFSSFSDLAHPEVIVHLGAQAGVRYSLENPRAYVDTNVVGTFNVMEAARTHAVRHLLMASTSSAYGANTIMPFDERQKADTPLTIYAATKKATEAMGHSYAHLHDLPTTMFRFFTVYGPWGRPDMAYFKFVSAILDGRPIDIYNHGEMWRDFTYSEDLVRAISLLIDAVPGTEPIGAVDTLSPVAPFRVVNIGNGKSEKLTDFIDAIEQALGITAKRNYMEIQAGDVPATWADNRLLRDLTGYVPKTDIRSGIERFVEWYQSYYGPHVSQ
ncbi:NAD-dependent epimerase/dehydratase family protein [Pontivivens insulae]|uniref:UDP-N-acetylglucosamine 4-epimerase n=1 Tax=Pontivivens insulae TaxID=1639689 RepID=A0A2R8A7X9_9RHOB|nr:NAD-dependent epimerase/dehydratase family protein [Pontivivens insulae]RED18435.1 UDP-glucuronate 4-epimerase [Pontivivens insulae]SPF28333.1 UDP-N-acetylglucosamine 4-epimerase [Pontivivens insulae]